MKLDSNEAAERKARYKLVRTDDFRDIEGLIIEADEATGVARMQREEVVRIELGADGFRIVGRGR